MADKIPIGINKIKGSTLIKKTDGLGKIRRGKEILFIERETASWIILSGAELEFFNSITQPVTVDELRNSHPTALHARQKENLLINLFHQNMVTFNGMAYYDPEALWKLPQQYPGFLCFHITKACNFACKYCYARANIDDAETKKMPREVAHRTVERILEDIPHKDLLIDFHGGEPFMAFDEMTDTIRYAQEYNKKRGINKNLKFITQTNGSLLSIEKMKILSEINCSVGVSLDGPAEVHDQQRIYPDGSETFEKIWKNIIDLREAGFYTGILSVIHRPENYLKTFRFLLNNGFKGFRINYSAYIGRAIEELEFPYGRAEAFAKHYLEMIDEMIKIVLSTGQPLYIKDIDNQINNIISKKRPFMCYRSPCGCGNSILGFGRDGGIYACEEATGVKEFCIGNVFENKSLTDVIDNSPILKLINSRTVDDIPKCKTCLFKRFCGGRCTTKSFARYGNFEREDPMCRYYQIIYPEIIWKIHDQPQIINLLKPSTPPSPENCRPT